MARAQNTTDLLCNRGRACHLTHKIYAAQVIRFVTALFCALPPAPSFIVRVLFAIWRWRRNRSRWLMDESRHFSLIVYRNLLHNILWRVRKSVAQQPNILTLTVESLRDTCTQFSSIQQIKRWNAMIGFIWLRRKLGLDFTNQIAYHHRLSNPT